jgi:hypothetical protein
MELDAEELTLALLAIGKELTLNEFASLIVVGNAG